MTRFVTLLCFGTAPAVVLGMKDCIEPIRASVNDELSCGADFALVPKTICDNSQPHIRDEEECHEECLQECQHEMEGSEVCAFTVEALFAEWRMMDGAFLTSGSCSANIQEGRFYAQDALKVMPENHELTGVRLLGRDLVRALEQGLVDYFVRGNKDAYPHTAGLKYELDLAKPEGHRVQNVQLLGYMCNWKPLQERESYMILTDSVLANTIFADVAREKKGTGRGSAESLFLYATSVCTLKDNWHRMRLKHNPDKIPLLQTTASSSAQTISARL